jgi:hypothetical protein
MDICHTHNLNKPLDVPKRYGIRVSIRATDTFARLLDTGWQQHHWYATRDERDRALADMASEHVYSRMGDKPTLVYEPVELPAEAEAPGVSSVRRG